MHDQQLEARKWLTHTKNPSALATNRFETTENALKFVEMLYQLGAEFVEVDEVYDEPERIQNEGGEYASGVVVYLPESAEKRAKLYEILNKEAKEQGFDEFHDSGENVVNLWWD